MFARTVRLLSKRVAPPPPRPFVASAPPPTPSSAESTLADSLMDSTASGIVMRTSIIFLSALAGAQLVHSVMQPDTVLCSKLIN
jgi:hypothetical protein